MLIGNAQKAKDLLGWESKIDLNELCTKMVEQDIIRNKNGFSF